MNTNQNYMTHAHLHQQLMQACENGNIEDVKESLDYGTEPNFNLKSPANALDTAIQTDNHQIIDLLLKHGAIVKEYVLQKAIERDKTYLHILIPNFKDCKDETLLMGVLQAAINIDDLDLAKQAIHQGVQPKSLLIYAVQDLCSTEILQLLIENGFNIHAEKNMIITHWMGASLINDLKNNRPTKLDLLAFISSYYLEKPKLIEKFKSLGPDAKYRLFLIGLGNNNFNMMRFAFKIGANKNEVLNSALHRYYANNHGNSSRTHSTMFKNHKSEKIDYEIIEYILNSNIKFDKITISNAVCFKYTELLNTLSCMDDLEYGYEMAYKYGDNDLQDYFMQLGVSNEVQSFAKMKVSAIKGDIKELRKAINDGANVEALGTDVIVDIINKNQAEILKYLYDSGFLFDTSLNKFLNQAMSQYKAYESISYLIEVGLNICSIKNIPPEYKKRHPSFADMWQKRFSDIFDYTIYLSREVYPNAEGKEKEEILRRISELSSLPYVLKKSEEKSLEH